MTLNLLTYNLTSNSLVIYLDFIITEPHNLFICAMLFKAATMTYDRTQANYEKNKKVCEIENFIITMDSLNKPYIFFLHTIFIFIFLSMFNTRYIYFFLISCFRPQANRRVESRAMLRAGLLREFFVRQSKTTLDPEKKVMWCD